MRIGTFRENVLIVLKANCEPIQCFFADENALVDHNNQFSLV